MPKDRALSPTEIRTMLKQLEHVATLPAIRLGMRLYLLTMVRKSELQDKVRARRCSMSWASTVAHSRVVGRKRWLENGQ